MNQSIHSHSHDHIKFEIKGMFYSTPSQLEIHGANYPLITTEWPVMENSHLIIPTNVMMATPSMTPAWNGCKNKDENPGSDFQLKKMQILAKISKQHLVILYM